MSQVAAKMNGRQTKGTILLDNDNVLLQNSKEMPKLPDYWASQQQHFSSHDEVFERLDLPVELSSRLFPHQRVGVDWMYNLYRNKCGGILGDDMGMGKVRVTHVLSMLICLLI